MTAIVWPDGKRFVQLFCRLGVATPDTTEDVDKLPDVKPNGGTVELIGGEDYVRVKESDGIHRLVSIVNEVYTINPATGALEDHNGEGVYILDPTTHDPKNWTYTAKIIPDRGRGKIEIVFGGSTPLPDTVDLISYYDAGILPSGGESSLIQRVATLEANQAPGTTLNVSWQDDRAVINGQVSPPLTGPAPTIDWQDDKLVVGNVVGPPLTGPAPSVAWDNDKLVVGGVTGPSLKGPPGDTGAPGSPGAPGAPGALANASSYMLVGPGRPDTPATTGGIITGSEPNGAFYYSTDGAGVGAWEWRKRGTKWELTNADTGWRVMDISTLDPDVTGNWYMRFYHDKVSVVMGELSTSNSTVRTKQITLNPRFRPKVILNVPFWKNENMEKVFHLQLRGTGWANLEFRLSTIKSGGGQVTDFTYSTKTENSWPTTIPGTPE